MSQGAGLLGRGLSALGTCLAPGRSLDTDHRVTEAQGPPGHPQLVWGRADVKVAEWLGGAGEAGGVHDAPSPHLPRPAAHPAPCSLDLHRTRADLGIRDAVTVTRKAGERCHMADAGLAAGPHSVLW